jgi:hypothetical protein
LELEDVVDGSIVGEVEALAVLLSVVEDVEIDGSP